MLTASGLIGIAVHAPVGAMIGTPRTKRALLVGAVALPAACAIAIPTAPWFSPPMSSWGAWRRFCSHRRRAELGGLAEKESVQDGVFSYRAEVCGKIWFYGAA